MGSVRSEHDASARIIRVAAAQVGAVHHWSPREETLGRLISLLEQAAEKKAQLVLFPETTLTTFFPRYFIEDEQELDSWFEHEEDITKSAGAGKLFEKAAELGIDIVVGYAERNSGHSYNTCVYFSATKRAVIVKYHKSHLPGTKEPYPEPDAINQLEKRYFEEGQGGFKAFRVPGLVKNAAKKVSSPVSTGDEFSGQGDAIIGLLICNDRRWAEAWRVYGLQGVELMLCGYNTTSWAPHLHGKLGHEFQSREQSKADAYFHHKLVMQSNSYTNSCFSVCAARCGMDDEKFGLIGGSCIVGPDGRIIAEAQTEKDELVFAEINLAACRPGKETVSHRRRKDLDCKLIWCRYSTSVGTVDQSCIACSSSRKAL